MDLIDKLIKKEMKHIKNKPKKEITMKDLYYYRFLKKMFNHELPTIFDFYSGEDFYICR